MTDLLATREAYYLRRVEYIKNTLGHLIRYCKITDNVIEINLIPKLPLAMGNYDMGYSFRRARHIKEENSEEYNTIAKGHIKSTIEHLIRYCSVCKFVITIELIPNLPLAMGNYSMIYSIRDNLYENSKI